MDSRSLNSSGRNSQEHLHLSHVISILKSTVSPPLLRAFYHVTECVTTAEYELEVILLSTIFRIRELRQERGLTQAQLAKSMGLKSSSTVTMWETGDRNPPSSVLPQLADALCCTIDELYAHKLVE